MTHIIQYHVMKDFDNTTFDSDDFEEQSIQQEEKWEPRPIVINDNFYQLLLYTSRWLYLLHKEFGRKWKQLFASLEDVFDYEIIDLLQQDIKKFETTDAMQLLQESQYKWEMTLEKATVLKEQWRNKLQQLLFTLKKLESDLDNDYILHISGAVN